MAGARLALAAAAVAALNLAPSSVAAYGCPMIVDQARDTTIWVDPTVERDMPLLDLRSVDFVSDGEKLTAVVRVSRLAASHTDAPFGARWGVTFRVSGTVQWYALSAASDMTGAISYRARYFDTTTGTYMDLPAGTTGTFNVKRSEVRITAPLDVFEGIVPLPPGTWLEAISAATGRNYVDRRVGYSPADYTRSGAHRIAGRSCTR